MLDICSFPYCFFAKNLLWYIVELAYHVLIQTINNHIINEVLKNPFPSKVLLVISKPSLCILYKLIIS